MFLTTLLGGVNMGLLRDVVKDCPLAYLFSSRKGLWNEKYLPTAQRKKAVTHMGRWAYGRPRCGISCTLTRGRGFWHEFWLHYDRVANYWRLEKLGAQVSPFAYLAACLVSLRRRPLPRLLATLYGWFVRL